MESICRALSKEKVPCEQGGQKFMKINNDHQRKNAMIFYQMEMSGDRYGKLLCTRRSPEFFMLANIMVEEKL